MNRTTQPTLQQLKELLAVAIESDGLNQEAVKALITLSEKLDSAIDFDKDDLNDTLKVLVHLNDIFNLLMVQFEGGKEAFNQCYGNKALRHIAKLYNFLYVGYTLTVIIDYKKEIKDHMLNVGHVSVMTAVNELYVQPTYPDTRLRGNDYDTASAVALSRTLHKAISETYFNGIDMFLMGSLTDDLGNKITVLDGFYNGQPYRLSVSNVHEYTLVLECDSKQEIFYLFSSKAKMEILKGNLTLAI